jgi:hypothetical protein
LAASQESAASDALEHKRALGVALTAQMVAAASHHRLSSGHPWDTSTHPEAPHASGLDTDHIALHTQAVGLHNIWSLISIVLDLASSHYPCWRWQVLLNLRRYALADHILDDIITLPSSAWSLMDTVVLSWLHDTIIVELQNIIRDQAHTGSQAWLALEEQFLGNRDARALHLDA